VPASAPLGVGRSNGREAFIARAYCRRMLAQRGEDLERCRADLGRAEAILEAEARDPAANPADVVPERMAAEMLLLDVTALYFSWLEDQHGFDPQPVLPDLLARLAAFVRAIEFDRFAPVQGLSPDRDFDRDLRRRALLSATERCAAAYLALALQFGQAAAFAGDDSITAMVDALTRSIEGRSATDTVEMTQVVLGLARLIKDLPSTSREAATQLVRTPFAELQFPQHAYDRARLQAMQNRVRTLVLTTSAVT